MGEELDGLVLRYEYRDTDGTGRLNAEVRFDGFAGTSSAWFGEAELVGFAARTRARRLCSPYPVSRQLARRPGDLGGACCPLGQLCICGTPFGPENLAYR